MTKLRDLLQLQSISQAVYDREKQNFQRILTEENTLRSELSRLSDLDGNARMTVAKDTVHSVIGADVLWQGWMSRAKTELNMKLARVLATKEYQVARVRKTYGKLLVAEELVEQTREIQRKRTEKRTLNEAINAATLRIR